MKYSSTFEAYQETGCSKAFYQQFKTAKPEIGKIYKVVGCGIITQQVKIIAIVDKVAIGKVISDDNNNSSIGEMSMYYIQGAMIGWQYKENRSGYRLQELT